MDVDQCHSIHYGNWGSRLVWVGSGSNFRHGLGSWNARPAHSYWIGHCEHLKCVKTVWRLRAEVFFTSVEKNHGYGPVVLAVWKGERSHDRQRQTSKTGALLIIYINIVLGANHLWSESSVGRDVHGAKRLWGEMSFRGAKCPWGEMTVGWKVHKP